ncbi:energy-coupling factor transporter transmembrane protein EcfT [Halalkalicoccus sp. NIPERK01]|uniref:energy-coupling factor transporter transmembrane component T family protein n=1 Tax=Halalkalicoccus sp. NIPERK01 TaxID=3053469 RepID=UPI00256F376F|nr:energy-coupling factor transporter transmembrane component T [Halalkalicoccus sp. NIPERK01]MDL5362888.1 energy-coupling factor transporter transmembrane component T [Halalkalicoccus sp. NIPERK01]
MSGGGTAGTTDVDVEALIENAEGADSPFEYRPGSSPLHRLNPVTKLVASGALILIAFLLPTFWGPLALTVGLFALVATAGAGVARSVGTVLVAVGGPLALSLVLIQGLFYPQNETVLVSLAVPVIDRLAFYEEGIEFALLILFRLTVLMIALLGAIVTTHPKKLTVALMEKGVSNKVAYVFMAALQFIPQMQTRAKAILDAQQARGLDTAANLRRRLKSYVALMAPLLIGTLISTETRALALESRGFTRKGERTYLLDVSDSAFDRAIRWLSVLAVIAVFVWRLLL